MQQKVQQQHGLLSGEALSKGVVHGTIRRYRVVWGGPAATCLRITQVLGIL